MSQQTNYEEPTYENHEYHPQGYYDRNLRKINKADWLGGVRCTCAECLSKYESSRDYKRRRDWWDSLTQ